MHGLIWNFLVTPHRQLPTPKGPILPTRTLDHFQANIVRRPAPSWWIALGYDCIY
jgi:hypothetical protein